MGLLCNQLDLAIVVVMEHPREEKWIGLLYDILVEGDSAVIYIFIFIFWMTHTTASGISPLDGNDGNAV